MKLCQIIIQFFDKILKKGNFKEAEQKDLCKRLFRVWMCRSAEHNLPLLEDNHQDLYIKLVQNIDESTDKSLIQLEKLTNELRINQEIYQQFRQNMLNEAQEMVDDLIKEVSVHITPEESQSLSHTFNLIKEGQLPSKI